MARVLRSIPEHIYLWGFPGLSEALAEFGLVGGHQATFLIDRAITHWNLETKPYLHLQATDDGPTLLKRLTTLRKCLRTIEYAMGTQELLGAATRARLRLALHISQASYRAGSRRP